VRIVELPGLPAKGDVSDWLAAGGTPAELTALIEATPPRTAGPLNGLPGEVLQVEPPGDPYANAGIFVSHMYTHPERVLIAYQNGYFYRWDGSCWPVLVDDILRAELYAFFDRCGYYAGLQGIVPFRPTKPKVTNLLDALAARVQLATDVHAPAWLSPTALGPIAATDIVACQNGLLHVLTRELLSHTPQYFVHHAVPYAYTAAAPPPQRWLQFLTELFDDDTKSIDTLQEMLGYLITGATHLQKMFLLVGPPRSGKSTIGRVIHGLVGSHNVAGPTLSSMATNFGLASLINRPVALIADARLRSEHDVVTERLLSISGEDMLSVDRKYREAWIGRIPSRIVILTNELPRLGDMSGALANRFIIVVFQRSFLGNEDPTLTQTLLGELPGIFNWALDGLDRLTDRGYFIQPESSADTMRELEDLGSPLKAFVRDCCELDAAGEVEIDVLFRAYERWCTHNGRRSGSVHTFGKDLRAAVPTISTRQSKEPPYRRYVGIHLTPGQGNSVL
jgi:putative DNA primase/helicase